LATRRLKNFEDITMETDRKSCKIYRLMSLSMILNDPNPDIQGHAVIDAETV